MFENFWASFAKQPFTLDEIQALMKDPETFPQLIIYAIPVMVSFVALEFFLSQREKKHIYDGKDLLASVGIGVGNLLSGAALNIALFAIILFFYNLVPWTVPIAWWSFIACFVVLDFLRYWAHRLAHEQRFWWATHVTHHSSEKYNFSVSFRLSWVQQVKIIFFVPAALMGFHPVVFFICHQVLVLYQYWLHTQLIKRTPAPIEYIFVTPSHHRVHHGTNPQYIDRNYGSTFIIWDRMFGTFEQEDEPVRYGITKPVGSYNPVYLVFHEFIDIYKDLRHANSARDYWRILFGYPGTYTARTDAEEAAQSESVGHDPAGNGAAPQVQPATVRAEAVNR